MPAHGRHHGRSGESPEHDLVYKDSTACSDALLEKRRVWRVTSCRHDALYTERHHRGMSELHRDAFFSEPSSKGVKAFSSKARSATACHDAGTAR